MAIVEFPVLLSPSTRSVKSEGKSWINSPVTCTRKHVFIVRKEGELFLKSPSSLALTCTHTIPISPIRLRCPYHRPRPVTQRSCLIFTPKTSTTSRGDPAHRRRHCRRRFRVGKQARAGNPAFRLPLSLPLHLHDSTILHSSSLTPRQQHRR
jgi:hypothetical protein